MSLALIIRIYHDARYFECQNNFVTVILHSGSRSMTGTISEKQGRKDRGKKEGRGQERRKCHLEGGALDTACAKGICREFIKI